MSWNNRIFRHVLNGEHRYALHETFYEADAGLIKAWTKEPVTEFSESIDELIQDLEQKLADAKRFRNTVLLPDASTEENNELAKG